MRTCSKQQPLAKLNFLAACGCLPAYGAEMPGTEHATAAAKSCLGTVLYFLYVEVAGVGDPDAGISKSGALDTLKKFDVYNKVAVACAVH